MTTVNQDEMSESATQLKMNGWPVTVVRTRRRTAALQVRQGQIIVRCPVQMPDLEITQWIEAKKIWLQRHLVRQHRQQAARPELTHGARWHYRGEPLTLSLCQRRRWTINRQSGELQVAGPDLRASRLSQKLGEWYRSEASKHMTPLTQDWARQLGVESRLSDVRFRRTRSKWGHCSPQGRIQYNWQIMQAPDRVIEYLVIHEVCHLRHSNHGREFWTLVQRHCPHHRHARNWLREHGNSLEFRE